jgi:uncharacterized membrane protein YfhO
MSIKRAYILEDMSDEGDLINLVSRTANSVEVEVSNLPDSRILLCVDAWYPGWQAWVDGQPAAILRANDAFKAVVVPAGTHKIRFEYHSTRTLAGVLISLNALIVVLGLIGWLHTTGKKTGPSSPA